MFINVRVQEKLYKFANPSLERNEKREGKNCTADAVSFSGGLFSFSRRERERKGTNLTVETSHEMVNHHVLARPATIPTVSYSDSKQISDAVRINLPGCTALSWRAINGDENRDAAKFLPNYFNQIIARANLYCEECHKKHLRKDKVKRQIVRKFKDQRTCR